MVIDRENARTKAEQVCIGEQGLDVGAAVVRRELVTHCENRRLLTNRFEPLPGKPQVLGVDLIPPHIIFDIASFHAGNPVALAQATPLQEHRSP